MKRRNPYWPPVVSDDERMKIRARKKALYAVKKGKLIPKPCEVCGTSHGVERHHADYSKPLDVTWLCSIHHKAVHVEQRRCENAA